MADLINITIDGNIRTVKYKSPEKFISRDYVKFGVQIPQDVFENLDIPFLN